MSLSSERGGIPSSSVEAYRVGSVEEKQTSQNSLRSSSGPKTEQGASCRSEMSSSTQSTQPLSVHSSQVPPSSPANDELPLQNYWTFWYDEKATKGMERDSYASALKRLGEFGTVQEFWRYMNHIDVANLPSGSNLRMFKSGIEPTWEDAANASGGKYVFEVPSGVAIREAWTYTLLALVGETFENNHTICGAVLSLRPRHLTTINIWNSCAYNNEDIARGEAAIQRLIVAKLAENKKQPVTLQLRYQPHQRSLDWNNLWTQTKSKESVLAQLAAEATPSSPRKTLTYSPHTSRRNKLSTGDTSHGKAPLRSSTGSLDLIASNGNTDTSANDSKLASSMGHSHAPLITHPEQKKNASQTLLQSGNTRPAGHSKVKSADFPRNVHTSAHVPPIMPLSGSSTSQDTMEDSTGHSSEGNDGNDEEEMRSPLLMLGEPSRASHQSNNTHSSDANNFASGFRPMSPHGNATGSNSPRNVRHSSSGRPTSSNNLGVPLKTPPTTFLHRTPSSSEQGDWSWASLNSLTSNDASGESDSATSSPRFGLLSSSSPSYSMHQGNREREHFLSSPLLPTASFSPSRINNAIDPTVHFASVVQEIKSQWWLNRRNKRRGRPSASSAPSSPNSNTTASTSSNDAQLRVPDATSSEGNGMGDFSGLVLSSALPGEKRRRKRPSRGGSRDKSRSKDASAASSGAIASLSPRTVPEDMPMPDDPEVIVHHDIPSNFASQLPVLDSIVGAEKQLKSRRRSRGSQNELSSSANTASTSTNYDTNIASSEGSEGSSTGLLKERTFSEKSLSGSSASLPRHASFTDEVEIVNTPSVVIVGEDAIEEGQSTANLVKHHRKRSRGRGGGSSSNTSSSSSKKSKDALNTSGGEGAGKSSNISSNSGAQKHPHTPVLQYVQTFAMIFIIILLMVLCYLFGRMQGMPFSSSGEQDFQTHSKVHVHDSHHQNRHQEYVGNAQDHLGGHNSGHSAAPTHARTNPRPNM